MTGDFKKYIGLALAVLMMLPSLQAEASEKEKEEINTSIYQVDMPANTEGIFDFILDPQGLIDKTDAAAYGGKKFEAGSTVFFRRTEGEPKEDYSSASDHVTIVNKSSIPVKVALSIKVSDAFAKSITFTDDKKFKKDKDANLYLALKNKDKEIPIGKDGLDLDVTIEAAPDGAYEYSYDNKSEKYTYKLKEDSSGILFDEYSFQLTGAANGKGDWTKLEGVVPEIKVDWKVFPEESAVKRRDAVLKEDTAPAEETAAGENGQNTERDVPDQAEDDKDRTEEERTERKEEENKTPSIEKREYKLSAGNPVSIDVDLGSGDTAASQVISVRRKDTGVELMKDSDEAVYKDGKVRISREWVDKCIEDKENMPESLVVTFDDVNSTEVEITLKE